MSSQNWLYFKFHPGILDMPWYHACNKGIFKISIARNQAFSDFSTDVVFPRRVNVSNLCLLRGGWKLPASCLLVTARASCGLRKCFPWGLPMKGELLSYWISGFLETAISKSLLDKRCWVLLAYFRKGRWYLEYLKKALFSMWSAHEKNREMTLRSRGTIYPFFFTLLL